MAFMRDSMAAFGAMAAAYQRGMRIGREKDCDLRIAGHDDHPLSRYACPALTTVSQDYAQIARTSLDILLQEMQEEHETAAKTERTEATLLEAKLIMRESA